jgi:GNAT superfamily N-acetyltransferase
MLVHLDVVTAHEILGNKARIFGHSFFDKHCGRDRTAHLEWRTLTATIGNIPLGFVMYFRYKGRGSGAFSVTDGGERSEIDHGVGGDGLGGGVDVGGGGGGGRPTSHIKGGYIDLFWILVHPSYREMGVGSSLIKEVSKRGRAEWPVCDQVRLYVMDSNVNALSLYRTHGFERIKRRENYPEIGTASYRMVKRFQMDERPEEEEIFLLS